LFVQVKFWITHNEPWVVAHHGYESGEHAPGNVGQGYKAGHNLIRAHGKAYRLYEEKYKSTQNGNELNFINTHFLNLKET